MIDEDEQCYVAQDIAVCVTKNGKMRCRGKTPSHQFSNNPTVSFYCAT